MLVVEVAASEILLLPVTVKSSRTTEVVPAPVMVALTPLPMMSGASKPLLTLIPPTRTFKVEVATGAPVRLTLPPMSGMPAVVGVAGLA